MYAVYETSHAPALIPAHKLGTVATREAAEAFLAERNVKVICFDLDDENDAADVAGSRGSQIILYTVTRI